MLKLMKNYQYQFNLYHVGEDQIDQDQHDQYQSYQHQKVKDKK